MADALEQQPPSGPAVVAVDYCNQFRIHVTVGRWKRGGVIVVLYSTDHDLRHVHVFEDGRRLLKFDLES